MIPRILICWLALAAIALGEVVPSTNRVDWIVGSTVGVPGELLSVRSNRTSIYTNMPAGSLDDDIEAALYLAPSNSIVMLSNGTYFFTNGINWSNVTGVTISGQSKTGVVVYAPPTAVNTFSQTVSGGAPGTFSAFTSNIFGTYAKGASNISLLSGTGIATNRQIVFQNFGDTNYVWSEDASPITNLFQYTMIVAVSAATNITIWPPLYWQMNTTTALESHETALAPRFIGMENMTIRGRANATTISLSRAYAPWVYNVRFETNFARAVSFNRAIFYEINHCELTHQNAGTTSIPFAHGSQGCSAGLVINNWAEDIRMLQELTVVSGSAFCFNWATNIGVTGSADMVDGCINGCHGSHPFMNLFEGNIIPNFQADGVHGSSSSGTIYRNWFDSRLSKGTQFRRMVDLCRGQWFYNVVGNVLGDSSVTWHVYEYPTNITAASTNTIYRFGFPNQGNNTIGTNDYRALTSPGYDPYCVTNTYRHGNYDYNTASIIWDAGNADHALPASLLFTSKPSWWGNLTFPAVDITNTVSGTLSSTNLPAYYRYLTGNDPPAEGPDVTPPELTSATIAANGTTLTLVFDEAVTQGAGYADADWNIDASTGGNDIAITYSSGNGTATHVYTIGTTIEKNETVNIDFNGDANSEEDASGNDLAAIVSDAVTNNSDVDVTPPSPDPMTFSVNPAGTSTTAITMTASTATDADTPPVEYFFDETSGNPGASDSGWQASASYTDTGLTAATQYTYRVKARDSASTPNETAYSGSQSAFTFTNNPTQGGTVISGGVRIGGATRVQQ